MSSEYEDFRQRIIGLQHHWSKFQVFFLDKYGFKDFADKLSHNVSVFREICITGYFSEAVRREIQEIARFCKVRLICSELGKSSRDKKNLEALKKLADIGVKRQDKREIGVEIKVNSRLHARFLVAHNPSAPQIRGLLVIGSFDFNIEGTSLERYDAGIKTMHPDLIKSSVELFNEIWDDPSSLTLDETYA